MSPPRVRSEKEERWDRIIHFMRTRVGLLMLISFAAMFVLGALLPKPPSPLKRAWSHMQLQASRTLALALYSYANDHQGKYPEGKSSTEVFQQLIDGNYITDPGFFYFPMARKVKPGASSEKRLKPENVCFDFTAGITTNSPEIIPLVYPTGFRVKYEAGASAFPLTKGSPEGMAVAYKSNVARYFMMDDENKIPHFIPEDFDPKGQTYRQLTPEGELTSP